MKRRKRTVYRPALSSAHIQPGIRKQASSVIDRTAEANAWAAVEHLARIIAIVAIFLYATGLVAVNGYLLQYDVSDFSLVRTRFIYTGGLIFLAAFIPNAFVGGLALGVREIAKVSRDGEADGHVWGMLAGGVMVIIITITLFDLFLSAVDPGSAQKAVLPFSAPAAILVLAAIALGWLLFRVIDDIGSTMREYEKPRIAAMAFSAGYATIAIASCGLYVILFMTVGYPRIPSQFGGGLPHEVRLLVTKEAIPAAKELGLSFPSNSQLSKPVQLLYEADQQYVLRVSNARTAVINKSLVSGLTT